MDFSCDLLTYLHFTKIAILIERKTTLFINLHFDRNKKEEYKPFNASNINEETLVFEGHVLVMLSVDSHLPMPPCFTVTKEARLLCLHNGQSIPINKINTTYASSMTTIDSYLRFFFFFFFFFDTY